MAKKVETRFKGQYGRHYIREWRKFRRMTLEALASRVGEKIGGFTHASLSRIERGLQPYSQPILEAIADALRTDPASLMMRDPTDPDAIWSVWEQAKPGEREVIVDMAASYLRRVRKTGT
jgi:transcriptional regulator with XRE-family HTH domain